MNGIQVFFRWCPPGSFLIGNPPGEPERKEDEQQARVKLTKGFWIAETEPTQQWYLEVMRRIRPSMWREPTMESLGWYEAVDFCRKLTQRERQADRIPANVELPVTDGSGMGIRLSSGFRRGDGVREFAVEQTGQF